MVGMSSGDDIYRDITEPDPVPVVIERTALVSKLPPRTISRNHAIALVVSGAGIVAVALYYMIKAHGLK